MPRFSREHLALAAAEPRFQHAFEQIGVMRRTRPQPFEPFNSLARSIVYQQLSGKAAATILGRVFAAAGSPDVLSPADIDALSDAALRAAGISGNKALALRDLSEKAKQGVVPDYAKLRRWSDQEIIDHLTQVRGIGTWTVQMMLIFSLGRPDVMPIADLGVQKGAMKLLGLEAMPKPKQLADLSAAWRPHSTLAALYLWRIADTVA
jgi:DNA-3-methyladenine glycosylase II